MLDVQPLPRAIASQRNKVEVFEYMGLFPEINRAWIIVDQKLFLWNYSRPDSLELYEGIEDVHPRAVSDAINKCLRC